MAKTKHNHRKGLHLHRTHPILFGGNPTDRQNITFISRLQHSELATYWNRKLREVNNQVNETITEKLTNNFNTVSPASLSPIETVERFFNSKLPNDYKEFLQFINGFEGETTDSYLVLWSTEELVELNQAYNVNEFVSNIILIGSDGAEDAYGFDTTNMTIVKLPFIGMGYIENEKLSDTFGKFLSSQIKKENKGIFKRLFGRYNSLADF